MIVDKLDEHMEIIMKILLLFIVASSLISSCSYINKKAGLEDDHIFEEYIEEHIKDRLGLDIDLTPESKEK